MPAFLKHIAHDVYVCGKTINLLRLCCPRVSEEAPMLPTPALLALPLVPLASRAEVQTCPTCPPRLAVCPYLWVSTLELGPW